MSPIPATVKFSGQNRKKHLQPGFLVRTFPPLTRTRSSSIFLASPILLLSSSSFTRLRTALICAGALSPSITNLARTQSRTASITAQHHRTAHHHKGLVSPVSSCLTNSARIPPHFWPRPALASSAPFRPHRTRRPSSRRRRPSRRATNGVIVTGSQRHAG